MRECVVKDMLVSFEPRTPGVCRASVEFLTRPFTGLVAHNIKKALGLPESPRRMVPRKYTRVDVVFRVHEGEENDQCATTNQPSSAYPNT